MTKRTGRRAVLSVLSACVLAGAAGVAFASPGLASTAPATGCATVQQVVVRGTNETPAPIGWVEAPTVTAIPQQAAVAVSTYGLDYPAAADVPAGNQYWNSVPTGVANLTAHLTQEAAACPNEKFVLVGFSQGAWVVGNALAGVNPGDAPPISSTLGAKIAAVVLYGDPRFTAGESFNKGSFTPGTSGVYPRAAGALNTYANRLADYCVATDPVCQNGVTGPSGHGDYVSAYVDQAATFVANHLPQAATAPTPTPATTTTITGYGSKCVDVAGANTSNGTQIQLYGCNGTAAQNWTIGTDSTIKALSKCMDVAGGKTGDGTRVRLWDCNGTAAQKWVYNATAKTLINPNSGKCLDATNVSSADGTALQIWSCFGNPNQKWTLAS